MEIIKYTADKKKEWDSFVTKAKNTHFIFYRDYMEYHSDRFVDFSLMIYDGNKLISLFPANIKEKIIYSHGGLTFGGFITDNSMNTPLMLKVFDEFVNFCKKDGIKEINYKCIPYTYHLIPAEEDRYALFINNAFLYRRDVSSTVFLNKPFKYYKGRKWSINKGKNNSINIIESEDYELFWRVLEKNLADKYKNKPVHNVDEIIKLHSLFKENIKLFVAEYNKKIEAGVVLYINKEIVHCQYMSSTEKGKELCAIDFLIDQLIHNYKNDKLYFDFGISNEQEGRYLNEGLIQFKEGFGARSVCHDFYKILL